MFERQQWRLRSGLGHFLEAAPQLGSTIGMRQGQHMFTITHNASIYSSGNGAENKPDIFHMHTKHSLFSWDFMA